MVEFVPVEHDPFAAEKFVPESAADWTKQAARKDVAALSEGGSSLVSMPRRALQSAETMRQDGEYDPGPILEAATLPLGTGAIAGLGVRAGEKVLGSGAIRARYDKALAEGKITSDEHVGFMDALMSTDVAEKFSGQQRHIADIIQESGLPKEQVQKWLIDEAKAGRVTIHPTTSVDLPREVMDAGFKLPGFSEPFVSAYFKPQPRLRPVEHDPFSASTKSNEPPRLKNFFAGESLKDIGETAEQIWQQNKGKMRGINEQLGRLRTMGVSRGDWTVEEVAEIEAAIKEKAKSPFVNQAKLDRAAEKAADKAEKNVGFKPVDHDPFGER